MNLFDLQPQTADLKCGPEPSIRMLLRKYYGEHFPADEVEKLVDEYITEFNIINV